MLAGVCAGVADYLGVDTTLVRVLWAVVSLVTGGAGVLAYLAASMSSSPRRPLITTTWCGRPRS